MRPLSILVIAAQDAGGPAESLRRSFPHATVAEAAAPPLERAGYDLFVVRAELNADFARVRELRKTRPAASIVVVSERDRSGAAYVAGANEFALSYDAEGLAQAVRQCLAASPLVA